MRTVVLGSLFTALSLNPAKPAQPYKDNQSLKETRQQSSRDTSALREEVVVGKEGKIIYRKAQGQPPRHKK